MAEKREFTSGDRVRVGKHEGVVSPSLNTVRVRFDDIGSAFDIAEHCVHLVEAAPESPKVRFWTCPAGDHRGTGSVEWRDNVAYCLVPGCDWNSTRPRPVYGEPEAGVEYNEDGEPEPGTERVGWSMAFGCRMTFNREGDGFQYFLSVSDDTKRKSCEWRTITPEQLRTYAQQLLELAGPAPVDGAAMDARAADRPPCDTPGCPCGGAK